MIDRNDVTPPIKTNSARNLRTASSGKLGRGEREYQASRKDTYIEDISNLFPTEAEVQQLSSQSPKKPLKFPENRKAPDIDRPPHHWFDRLIGLIRPGGLRSTVFNLLNATAGAAVVAMPGAFASSGLLYSFGLLILSCLVNFVSSSCLVLAAHSGLHGL